MTPSPLPAETAGRGQIMGPVPKGPAIGGSFAWEALQHAPCAMVVTDFHTGEFIEVNDRFLALVERPREALVGRTSLDAGIWKDPAHRTRLAATLMAGRSVDGEEVTLAMPDGHEKHLGVTISAAEIGGRLCALSVFTDVTARREADRARRDREALLSAINTNLPGTCIYRIIHHVDGRMECAYVSPTVEQLGGRPAAEFAANAGLVFAHVHPEDLPRLQAALAEALRTRGLFSVTTRTRTVSGDLRWMQFRSRLIETRADGAQVRDGVVVDITALKTAEAEVAAVHERLALALRASRTCTWESDIARKRITLDAAWAEMLGHPPAPTVTPARVLLALTHRDDRANSYAQAHQAIEGETDLYEAEHRVQAADGNWLWIRSHGRVTARDAAGRATRIIGTNTDVTARRVAEDALRALNADLERLVRERTASLEQSAHHYRSSEQRFRAVFDGSSVLFALLSMPDGRIVELNSAALAAFGYTREEVIGRTSVEITAWADAGDRERYMTEIAANGQVKGFETRMRRKDGEPLTVLLNGTLIQIDGRPYQLASMQDITAQRESEMRYRALIEASTDGIFVLDERGVIRSANRSAGTMHGYDADALVGRNVRELDDPEDAEIARLSPHWHAQLMAGDTVKFELRHRRRDGTSFPLEIISVPMKHGDDTFILSTARDISERRRAEAAVRESEERFRAVFDGSPIPILLATVPEGRIIEANPHSLTAFGYTREEVVGCTTDELNLWVKPEQRMEYFDGLARQRSVPAMAALMRTKTGAERMMLCSATLIAIGGTPYLLSSAIDITTVHEAEQEKQRVQARAFQNQKFEALGTLAGGIAHDFNNILTGVINFAALALEDCPPAERNIQEYLNHVLAGGRRVKELVQQILLFSRAEAGRREPLLLQNIVKEALALLRATLPATAVIESQIDPDAPVVVGDSTQLHQLLVNLVINAAQALGGHPGQISIRLQPRRLGAAEVVALSELKPGPHVRLEITDTGCGMSEAVLARIFEPFFTTKPVGEGTGLGLAVVHSVVRNHHAAIAVRSRPGAGTTFELYFPAVPTAAPAQQRGAMSWPRGSGQHVLVVDDEPLVGQSVALLLSRLGYRTSVFANPEEALARFAVAPREFHVVITDFQMPRMTGLTLAARIVAYGTGVPILLSTGYTASVPMKSLREQGVTDVLYKPFEPEQLAQTLARVVGAAPEVSR